MNKPLKVFNVLFDDRFGGPSKRVALVSGPLRQRGVTTTLVFPPGDGNAESIARSVGLEVVRSPFSRIPRPRNPWQVLRWFLKLPLDIFHFRHLYNEHSPDIVHVNGAFFLAPAIASKLTKATLIWHLNDVIVPPKMAPLLGKFVRILADRVVVSSRAVSRHYKVPSTEATVLYPPVDIERIRPREYAADWPSVSGPITIGLIANWNPIKGVDHFVRAAAQVHEILGEKLRVVLAGARLSNHMAYRQQVETLIDDLGLHPVVTDFGFQTDIENVLRELDIAVMSSTSEAVSMVVIEGMAAGLPVVATDVGGVTELLRPASDQPAGLVVPAAQPDKMAKAILTLVRAPERARQMGRAGRRYVEESFSIEKAAETHLQAYRHAMCKDDRLHESRADGSQVS